MQIQNNFSNIFSNIFKSMHLGWFLPISWNGAVSSCDLLSTITVLYVVWLRIQLINRMSNHAETFPSGLSDRKYTTGVFLTARGDVVVPKSPVFFHSSNNAIAHFLSSLIWFRSTTWTESLQTINKLWKGCKLLSHLKKKSKRSKK